MSDNKSNFKYYDKNKEEIYSFGYNPVVSSTNFNNSYYFYTLSDYGFVDKNLETESKTTYYLKSSSNFTYIPSVPRWGSVVGPDHPSNIYYHNDKHIPLPALRGFAPLVEEEIVNFSSYDTNRMKVFKNDAHDNNPVSVTIEHTNSGNIVINNTTVSSGIEVIILELYGSGGNGGGAGIVSVVDSIQAGGGGGGGGGFVRLLVDTAKFPKINITINASNDKYIQPSAQSYSGGTIAEFYSSSQSTTPLYVVRACSGSRGGNGGKSQESSSKNQSYGGRGGRVQIGDSTDGVYASTSIAEGLFVLMSRQGSDGGLGSTGSSTAQNGGNMPKLSPPFADLWTSKDSLSSSGGVAGTFGQNISACGGGGGASFYSKGGIFGGGDGKYATHNLPVSEYISGGGGGGAFRVGSTLTSEAGTYGGPGGCVVRLW